ncbi:uncharacterized protein PV06_05281 [Exophiala oligosperma]|uniref:Fungal N-terminal domain-containing protein n=1 Tax=Exophiala oligosperma TaxID=215243 RepID=A0A0D2DMS7_9EURO|nr:uncharacterized protein PV06_05281 [Exophiala oligosperma]KIW44258.1 hypothetical protein PV06_05281 [Exophiala oligosperma]
MSGVEATLGVVSAGAGLISLGIQLGESAMKLKRIYHAARDAPAIIQMLLLDLETMALALGQLENHRQHDNHGEELLVRCISRCQQCTQEVRLVVEKLERSLEKHFRLPGRLYSAFKERDVKDLLDDLERAKTSMHIAYTMYIHAEQQRRDREHQALLVGLREQVLEGSATISQQLSVLVGPSIQLMQIETSLINKTTINSRDLSHSRDQDDGRQVSIARMTRRKKDKPYFRTCFRFPSWLSSRIWNVALLSAQGRWNFEIKTWRIVPKDSLVFRYCQSGNLAGLQRLIGSEQASALDITGGSIDGYARPWSLLEVSQDPIFVTLLTRQMAANAGHIEICRFLLSLTVFPSHDTVLSNALDLCALQSFRASPEEMYKLFMEDPEFCPDVADMAMGVQPPWLTFCPSLRCLDLVLSHLGPEFLGLSADTKLDMALELEFLEPAGFLEFIGLQQYDNSLVCLRSIDGESILHLVASYLNGAKHRHCAWFHFGVDLLRHGADPHAVSNRWILLDGFARTPLIHLLRYDLYSNFTPAGLVSVIRDWADMIRQAGLNLSDYGRNESKVWESLGVGTHLRYLDGVMSGSRGIYIKRLIFGPNPQDWSVEFARCVVFSLRKLCPLPGAYPGQALVPDSILWEPNEEEQHQGPWDIISRKTLLSSTVDMRVIGTRSRQLFPNLIDGTQDDHGAASKAELCVLGREQRANLPYYGEGKSHIMHHDGVWRGGWEISTYVLSIRDGILVTNLIGRTS